MWSVALGATALSAALLPEVRLEGTIARGSSLVFDGVRTHASRDTTFSAGATFTWRPVRLPLAASTVAPVGGPVANVRAVEPREILTVFDREPTVQEVQTWAHRYAGADPVQVQAWLDRSRSFAALPEVTLELDAGVDAGQGFLYLDEDGLSPIPGSSPVAVIDDADRGRSFDLGLELRWDLSSLVMSNERIRMIAEARDLAELRERVRAEVTRIYFERRRRQVERLLDPGGDLATRVEREVHIQELTAELDALTGGAFSAALDRLPPSR